MQHAANITAHADQMFCPCCTTFLDTADFENVHQGGRFEGQAIYGAKHVNAATAHYGAPICRDCLDRHATCPCCGEFFDTDHDDATGNSEGDTCCSMDCAEKMDREAREWAEHERSERFGWEQV